MRGLNFFPKSNSEKIMHHKCRIMFLLLSLLSLLFLLWTRPVWAISADDLLKLLNITKFTLREFCDPDGSEVAINADPFMLFGVLEVVRKIHCVLVY